MARDCTEDRVLLSTHMQAYWEKVGYKPDTDSLNEVDDVIEVEVQVGRKVIEPVIIPESMLTGKYRSVIIRGFKAETSLESILEILSQHGLPSDFSSDNVLQNDQTGSLTVENLKPENCLTLIENMNRKRFLNRQIFITSVVARSPAKPVVNIQHSSTSEPAHYNPSSDLSSTSDSDDQQPPNLGKPLLSRHTLSDSQDDLNKDFVFGPPVSPSVQEKISFIEKKNPEGMSRAEKRKPDSSPETAEPSRKEKKIIREEEKKQEKLRKKLEYKEKNTLKVSINHTL